MTTPRDTELETLAGKIDREQIGRLMHESWSATKRAQGFHGPSECCSSRWGSVIDDCNNSRKHCAYFHADLIPWEKLPEKQKGINRHAFDAVLPYIAAFILEKYVEKAALNGAAIGWAHAVERESALVKQAEQLRSLIAHQRECRVHCAECCSLCYEARRAVEEKP